MWSTLHVTWHHLDFTSSSRLTSTLTHYRTPRPERLDTIHEGTTSAHGLIAHCHRHSPYSLLPWLIDTITSHYLMITDTEPFGPMEHFYYHRRTIDTHAHTACTETLSHGSRMEDINTSLDSRKSTYRWRILSIDNRYKTSIDYGYDSYLLHCRWCN